MSSAISPEAVVSVEEARIAASDPFRNLRASVHYPLIAAKAKFSQPHFHAKAMPDFWA